jgi:hypothetical protein
MIWHRSKRGIERNSDRLGMTLTPIKGNPLVVAWMINADQDQILTLPERSFSAIRNLHPDKNGRFHWIVC